MNKAPTSVVVLSVIAIVLGILGLCGTAWSVVTIFATFGTPNPYLESIRHETLYQVVSAVGLIVGLPVTIFMIVSAAASFKLRPWARSGMIFCAWFTIVQSILGVIFNVTYVAPKMIAGLPAGTPAEVRAALTGGLVGGVCGSILFLIFPICILYFYTRPHVINAFKGIFPASPTNFPVQFPETPPSPPRTTPSIPLINPTAIPPPYASTL